MSTDGQGTKWHRNIAENFNRLSRVHERCRQQTDRQLTDGFTMTYSERDCGEKGQGRLMTQSWENWTITSKLKRAVEKELMHHPSVTEEDR